MAKRLGISGLIVDGQSVPVEGRTVISAQILCDKKAVCLQVGI